MKVKSVMIVVGTDDGNYHVLMSPEVAIHNAEWSVNYGVRQHYDMYGRGTVEHTGTVDLNLKISGRVKP